MNPAGDHKGFTLRAYSPRTVAKAKGPDAVIAVAGNAKAANPRLLPDHAQRVEAAAAALKLKAGITPPLTPRQASEAARKFVLSSAVADQGMLQDSPLLEDQPLEVQDLVRAAEKSAKNVELDKQAKKLERIAARVQEREARRSVIGRS